MSATRPALPAAFSPALASNAGMAGAAVGGGSASGTFRQVHAEVARYIATADAPSAGASGAGNALTADGAALRARLAARAIGGDAVGEASVPSEAQQAFLEAIRPHAEAAAARLGVAPELVAAHAALESGWGRHAPGNNMFGIKAGSNWQGAVQALATMEVEDGVAHTRNERFRGYGDMAGSFEDYAGMLLDNPRYRRALNTGSDAQAFAQALQAGGYATDPAYADKLGRVAASIKASQQAQQSQHQ
jgi:flagellar protein FlgJ